MKTLSRNRTLLILFIIVALGVFLRSFKILETLGFGHDADLFSWIVKDILVDKHIRLIGQETSTAGIFVGPLFYYFLTPFYLISGFDPAASIIAAVTIGALTILSYFIVFRKLFDEITGFIAAFLQGVLSYRVGFDRWIVPTITVNLWCVWYLLAIIKISKGNLNYLSLAGLLSGLIWHVHIALAPILILIPLSVILSKKLPNLKQIGLFLGAFLIPMLPFFMFEIRHGFTQITNFFSSFYIIPENISGIYGSGKFDDVIRQSLGGNYLLNIAMLVSLLFLPKLKIITWNIVILILVWVGSLIAFFTLTKKLISEYYFESLRTAILVVIILYLSMLIKSKNKLLKLSGFGLLAAILMYSVYYVANLPSLGNGFLVRSRVVEFIKKDSVSKNFSCVSISHITKPGEDFGYRYLYWHKGIKTAKQNDNIPNYTIVFPFSLATESAKFRYGAINVIPPEREYSPEEVARSCPEKDYNLTNPFWGFTN